MDGKRVNLNNQYLGGPKTRGEDGTFHVQDGNDIYYVREFHQSESPNGSRLRSKPIIGLPAANPNVFTSVAQIERLENAAVIGLVSGANNVLQEGQGLDLQLQARKIVFYDAPLASNGGIKSSSEEVYNITTEGIDSVRKRQTGEDKEYEQAHYRVLVQNIVASLAISLTRTVNERFLDQEGDTISGIYKLLAEEIREAKNYLLKNPPERLVKKITNALDVIIPQLERRGVIPKESDDTDANDLRRQAQDWVTLLVILHYTAREARSLVLRDDATAQDYEDDLNRVYLNGLDEVERAKKVDIISIC